MRVIEGGERMNGDTRLGACVLAALAVGGAERAVAQAGAGERALEEVVVTAQYFEESLQDTPLAITAISGEALELRSLTNVEDVGFVVPNAYIRPGAAVVGPTPTIGIRGASQGDYNFAFEPAVAVYIDEVYHSTLLGSAMDLMDLERVEVLRGPQGTLFGKNSLGGALRLFSRPPQGDDSGYAEATFGDYDRLDLKAAFDMTIVPDKLFMRLSGASKQVDGYMDLLDFTCQMHAQGTPELAGTFPMSDPSAPQQDCKVGTLGAEKLLAGRAMLRYVASDDLELNFSVDYADDDQEAPPDTLLLPAAPANDGFVSAYIDQVFATYGIRYDERFLPPHRFAAYATHSDPLLGISYPSEASVESLGYSAKLDWSLSESLQAKVILAYREYDALYTHDPDLSPIALSNAWGVFYHDQTTAELRFSGTAGERLNWTAGAYYFDSSSHIGGAVDYVLNHWTVNDQIDDSNESVFAHVAYDLSDRLRLTTGVRYSENEKVFAFDHPGLLTVPEPSVGSEDRIDWKVALDYQLSDDLMLYASASTGFRPPGVSPRPVTVNQLTPFDSEEMVAYEIGMKGEYFDRLLRLNVAGFYSDYSDRLTSVAAFECLNVPNPTPTFDPASCPSGSTIWFIYTTNPATVKGIEVEATAEPTDRLALNMSLGWLDFESKVKDPTARGYRHPDNLIQPEWNLSFGVQYAVPFATGSQLTARLDWFYQDELPAGRNAAAPPEPLYTVEEISIVNARLTFEPPQRDWFVSLAVTNLLDEFYYYNKFSGSGFSVSGQPGRPREWAVSVRREFGG